MNEETSINKEKKIILEKTAKEYFESGSEEF